MNFFSALDRHLGWMGGMLVSPRATFTRMLARPPRFEALLPWIFVSTAIAEPVRVGQAFLLMRIAPIDGLLLFVQQAFQRFGPPVLGVFLLAFLRNLKPSGDGRRSFDVWSSTFGFVLAPLFLLTAIGGGLAALDLEVWFLPHHRIDLGHSVGWVRAVVAYGWPLALGILGFFVRAPAEVPTTTPPGPSAATT
jgi:hypothetical protein